MVKNLCFILCFHLWQKGLPTEVYKKQAQHFQKSNYRSINVLQHHDTQHCKAQEARQPPIRYLIQDNYFALLKKVLHIWFLQGITGGVSNAKEEGVVL